MTRHSSPSTSLKGSSKKSTPATSGTQSSTRSSRTSSRRTRTKSKKQVLQSTNPSDSIEASRLDENGNVLLPLQQQKSQSVDVAELKKSFTELKLLMARVAGHVEKIELQLKSASASTSTPSSVKATVSNSQASARDSSKNKGLKGVGSYKKSSSVKIAPAPVTSAKKRSTSRVSTALIPPMSSSQRQPRRRGLNGRFVSRNSLVKNRSSAKKSKITSSVSNKKKGGKKNKTSTTKSKKPVSPL